ncbi:hypothetical protein KP509_29G032400 [Ceratopteris richardii]|uniref:Ribosomal protein S14 n=1 Tax=Ceratopteris richardii TaxID=49495 RepID=A0A8T2R5S3_CERRI|nr:hypothetical protein KP509_29G032400 [Ceratopteris richardii]
MAKKSLIEKEKKKNLVKKYDVVRQSLKRQLKNSLRIQDKLLILEKLQSLPRNSAPSRLRNWCSLTGRPRLITEILVFPDTYSVKWHILVFFPE